MAEATEGSSTSGGTHEQLSLPGWLPPAVVKQVRRIEARRLPAEQRAILQRLATDARMRGVWTELSRRKRPGGGFINPAKLPVDRPASTQDEAQAEALGELFHFAFCAARDRVQVSKPKEVAEGRTKLLQYAGMLREIADDLTSTNSTDPLAAADAEALRRVAGWQEAGAAALRPPSDPLTIQNDRGDRVVRGVQIVIAAQLRATFGKALDRTAATLAGVGLGKRTSERITRSAFSRRKLAEEADF
jgi:hypothetical protein